MARLKYRWLLPLGHALIDCILLAILVAHWSARPEASGHPRVAIQPAVFLQDGDAVGWEPRSLPPPEAFMLILSGNLPAALVSDIVRPYASITIRQHHLDSIWFLVQEAAAFACWYVIGVWIEGGRLRLGKVMLAFLAVRLVIALTGFHEVGLPVQIWFWLGFGLWAAYVGLAKLTVRMRRGILKV